MRGLAFAVGLAMATSATAEVQKMGVLKDGDISVSVAWQADASGVLGRYRISNSGAAEVWVFDRLYRTGPSGFRTVDRDYAWHWLEADGVFRVAKIVPQLPAMKSVESPEVAYARRLPAGAALEGSVLLPARLDQELPYNGTPSFAPVAQIKSISFSVGYAEVDPHVVPSQIKAGDEVVLSLPYAWLIAHQRILTSEATALSVEIQR